MRSLRAPLAGLALACAASGSVPETAHSAESAVWTPAAPATIQPAAGTALAEDWYPRRARRMRFYEQRRRGPTFGFGGSISTYEPTDGGAADALLRGYARVYLNRVTALQGEVGYWSHSAPLYVVYPQQTSPGYADKLSDLPVGVSLLYFLRPAPSPRARSGAALYGGIGVAWHTWKEEFLYGPGPAQPPPGDQQTVIGYHYIAGLEVGAFAGGKLFGEYRYTVGRVDDLAGYAFKFDGSSLGGGIAVNF